MDLDRGRFWKPAGPIPAADKTAVVAAALAQREAQKLTGQEPARRPSPWHAGSSSESSFEFASDESPIRLLRLHYPFCTASSAKDGDGGDQVTKSIATSD